MSVSCVCGRWNQRFEAQLQQTLYSPDEKNVHTEVKRQHEDEEHTGEPYHYIHPQAGKTPRSPPTLAPVLRVHVVLGDKCQGCTCLCPFVLLSYRKTPRGVEDKVSMVTRRHLHAVPGTRSVNAAAALCFLWVNTLFCRWDRHRRVHRLCWSEVLPASVPFVFTSMFLSVCYLCRGPALSVQARAQGQEEKEGQEGHNPAGAHRAGHGTEQVGQTPDEGVGCVQTGSSPHFLPLPSPPDIQGDDDPHWQAAEVADRMRQALFSVFVWVVFLLVFHLPNTTPVRVRHRLTCCPVSDSRVRQQPAGQSLRSNQRCDQEQHHAICVAKEEHEAQGDDITDWVQLGQPGPDDVKEAQKNCGRKKDNKLL